MTRPPESIERGSGRRPSPSTSSAKLLAAGFVDPEVEVIRWTARLDTDRLRALYSTFSEIAALPDGERERALDQIAAVAEESFGGDVERPFQTALYTAKSP